MEPISPLRIKNQDLNRKVRRLEKRVRKLIEGLEVFGSHQKWCKVNHKEGIDCNCGYEQVIRGDQIERI